jgi:tetratricopeptide (TPR) repeat protein
MCCPPDNANVERHTPLTHMPELSEAIHSQIQQLSAEGDALASQRKYSEAIPLYWAAWDLLPEPKKEWEAATWVLAAIGDANFLGQDYAAGRDNLSNAMHCPGAIGNPFLHLRLGQCQFELGILDRAADELMRAYMGAGTDIFKDQDAKYLRFLQSKAKGVEGPKKPWQFWK